MKIKIRLKHLKIQKCLGKEIDNQIFKSVNKMMKTKHILLVFFAATLLPLHAQELTLEQARALALENNKDIHKSQLTFEQTGYDVSAYKANYFPKLSLSAADFYSTSKGELTLHGGNLPIYMFNPATGTYVPNVTVNPDGSYTLNQYALFPDQTIEYKVKNVFIAGVQLQQPLYMGGKVGTAYRMSKIGQQIASPSPAHRSFSAPTRHTSWLSVPVNWPSSHANTRVFSKN